MSLALHAAAVTDIGLVRTNNEDSVHAGSRLIAVADGIGGMPAGELASDIVIKAIAPLDAVGAIRQLGLMVGVELAPPAEGLRWGRRVCAGAVERGVLLRPLGDVVVLMPPLTITEDELDRIVTVLGEAIAEVAGP